MLTFHFIIELLYASSLYLPTHPNTNHLKSQAVDMGFMGHLKVKYFIFTL